MRISDTLCAARSVAAPGTFCLNARTDQLDVEDAWIAGLEHVAENAVERNHPVAGHRAAGRGAVAQHVITHLDKARHRNRLLQKRLQASLHPTGVPFDAETDAGEFREGDGIGERVGNVDVGIERRGVLDEHTNPPGSSCRLAWRDERGEAFGGLLPRQTSAAARLQIHRAGPQRRGDVDGLQQLLGRLATVVIQVGIDGELMIHRFHLRPAASQCLLSLV